MFRGLGPFPPFGGSVFLYKTRVYQPHNNSLRSRARNGIRFGEFHVLDASARAGSKMSVNFIILTPHAILVEP